MKIDRAMVARINPAYLVLWAALVVGLALRLYGIEWGLPDLTHPLFSYHPDESPHVMAAQWLPKGYIVPKHFMYGGTFYYTLLNSYVYFAGFLSDALAGINSLADSILLGRYFHTALAVLTIILLYEAGRLLYGKNVGALAAFFLAITPAHIICAQRVRPDELGAFFATLLLYFSVKIFKSDISGGLRYFVYSGLTVGVSMATRFPLGVFALIPITAYFISTSNQGLSRRVLCLLDKKVAVLIICTAIGYAVASPHTLIYFGKFIEGLRVQWHYQSGVFPDAVGKGPGFYQYGWLMLSEALGYALYILALGGVVYAVIRRSGAEILLLASIFPYLAVTSFASWVVVRYTVPILPFLSLLAAWVTFHMLKIFPRYRIGVYLSVLAIAIWTIASVVAYLRVEAGKNVRDVASDWIAAEVPLASSILTVRTYVDDYYFNPVISEKYSHGAFLLKEGGSDVRGMFRDQEFDYIILNEEIYRNMERLGDRHPLDQHIIFYNTLRSSPYKLMKEFKQPVGFLGIDLSNLYSSQDYMIVNPGIRIYKLVK